MLARAARTPARRAAGQPGRQHAGAGPRHLGSSAASIGASLSHPAAVLELPRLAGNAAVIRLLQRVVPPPARAAVLQRQQLTDAEVKALRDLRDKAHDLHEDLTGQVPAAFRRTRDEHVSMVRIHAATDAINHPNNVPQNLAWYTHDLAEADRELKALEAFLHDNLPVLAKIDVLYRAYEAPSPAVAAPAAGGPAPAHPLAAVRTAVMALDGELRDLATELFGNRGDRKALVSFLLRLERLVLPDNKELQKLRATNAQQAAEVVSRLINGGLVTSGKVQGRPYKSPYDKGRDNFGAAWSLKRTAGASGKGQWLRGWEYHVHATAVRAAGPGTPVTAFTVKKGHIKPSADPKALGVSINVANPAFTAQIQTGYLNNILSWANSDTGQALLALKE